MGTGECRNGGFPDWLQNDKSIIKRTNDEKYLKRVELLYTQIGNMAKGYLWKDNGPIVGIQLENEYSGRGISDLKDRILHMSTLKILAIKAGLDAPIYTAIGWGGTTIVPNETLPVLGGYADAIGNNIQMKCHLAITLCLVIY